MVSMSMYIDMLSSALEAWDLELSNGALLDHTVVCRVRMLATGTAHGATAYQALAAELAYDRALIHLCRDVGIATNPLCFDQPQAERGRLEQTLRETEGIDLVALSRAHRAEMARPSVPVVETCRQR
jgi:hypothetical protein